MRLLISVLVMFLLSISSYAQIPQMIGMVMADTQHTQFGQRIMPLGDQNDDGYDDFLTWGFDKVAYLFYGGPDLDSTTPPALQFDSAQNRFNVIGDLNGDSYDDILIGGRNPVNWKMNVFYGGPEIDTVRDLWFGSDVIKGDGFNAYTNDINNNGNPEIWTWFIQNSSVVLYELGSDSDSLPDLEMTPANLRDGYDYAAFGEGIISGDFNGDGHDDLAVGLRFRPIDSLNGQVYLYWGGDSFDTIPDMIITRPGNYEWTFEKFGETLEYLGDVNGDGYDDFFVDNGNSADTMSFIYFGGPDIDTIPDVRIYEYCEKARLAGDINGDGYNDLITSLPLYLAGVGYVNIYYGGAEMDSIPDIIIRETDIPKYQDHFGNDCTGVGDVNGDGINDFAFSAVNGLLRGVVYIFSGTGSSTDIKYEYDPTLPESFELKQNYPNPFNPSTTIEFSLTTRQDVKLEVYNILGGRVATLLNKQLPAGHHTIEWDGKDDNSNQISSGIYLYRLTTGETVQTKKMVLIK